MSDQSKSLPTRGGRHGNGRPHGRTQDDPGRNRQNPPARRLEAPRSTPGVVPQPAQSRLAIADYGQSPSIATNPIFPQERPPPSYQLASGEQPNPRISQPSASEKVIFRSTLNLTLRNFASIPRGDYENVATYIRANPSILREDPQALLTEAKQAYQHARRADGTQYHGKMMYGDSCIQQYVILKRLQQLQQNLVEVRQPRRVTAAEVDDTLKRYFDQLLDQTSPSRKQLYEEFSEACAKAKESHRAKPGPQTNVTSPQQPQTQIRVVPPQARRTSHSGPPLQGSLPINIATLNLNGPGGDDKGNPRQPAPTPNNSRSENATGLDSRYIVRPSIFYKPGRVFAMLWHEPYSDNQSKLGNSSRNTYLSDKVSTGLYGERIYSSIRRMVVIRADHGCSVCVQISTYGRRGLGKFAASPTDVHAHSLIYMDDTEPRWLLDEPRSNKRDIAVKKASPDQRLDPSSRLCYSHPHTVQHTVKALDVGCVNEQSLPYLLSYFRLVNGLS